MILLTLVCLLATVGPPKAVTYNWRQAGEYPFSVTDPNTIKYMEYTEYRESGLRIAQPSSRRWPMSSGDIRPVDDWLKLVIKNWLRSDSDHVLDGNLWRDGRVNYTDFAVISRWWQRADDYVDPEPEPTELEIIAEMISVVYMDS